MVNGPCGGVRPDGSCEVGDFACPFLELPLAQVAPVRPAPLGAPARELLDLAAKRPLVVVDLAAPPLDAEAQRAGAEVVAGHVDAVLLGDAPWARVQLPPSLRARLVAEAGVRPWVGLNCRDRNRIALEAELAALSAVGCPAVHCVTGDHHKLGHRPDAPGVFDLDSVQLAALAAGFGLAVSVAESPAAPPIEQRPRRVMAKREAGARICFVNHCGGVDHVAAFVELARAQGAEDVLFIACVPLATSAAALHRLRAFAGDSLPRATVAAIDAPDPVGAGVRAAVAAAEAMLAIDGVVGVDLSSPTGPGEELQIAGTLALTGAALGGGS